MRIRERAEEYGTHTLINKELIALLTGAELDINNINDLRDEKNLLNITDLQRLKNKGYF